jgi:hypothetical protein
MRSEKENAPRQGRVETAERGQYSTARAPRKVKTDRWLRCVGCGRRVREDQIGARTVEFPHLLCWCRPCEAKNQLDLPR